MTRPLPASNADALHPGARLDDYQIESVLQSGDFSVVYRAQREHSMRVVTIEEYLPTVLATRGSDQHLLLRNGGNVAPFDRGLRAFVEECKLLAACRHPALPEVERWWLGNGTAYREVAYVQATSLRALRDGMVEPPDEEALRCVVDGLLGALETLHVAGYTHGAISPHTVVLRAKDDSPLLMVHGAAQRAILGDGGQAVLRWLDSPRGEAAVAEGPWLDLLGLADLVRFCIDGRHDVRAPAVDAHVPARTLADSATALAQRFPGLHYSASFIDAIEWALTSQPGDRPESVAEFRIALERPLREAYPPAVAAAPIASTVVAFPVGPAPAPAPLPVVERAWPSAVSLPAGDAESAVVMPVAAPLSEAARISPPAAPNGPRSTPTMASALPELPAAPVAPVASFVTRLEPSLPPAESAPSAAPVARVQRVARPGPSSLVIPISSFAPLPSPPPPPAPEAAAPAMPGAALDSRAPLPAVPQAALESGQRAPTSRPPPLPHAAAPSTMALSLSAFAPLPPPTTGAKLTAKFDTSSDDDSPRPQRHSVPAASGSGRRMLRWAGSAVVLLVLALVIWQLNTRSPASTRSDPAERPLAPAGTTLPAFGPGEAALPAASQSAPMVAERRSDAQAASNLAAETRAPNPDLPAPARAESSRDPAALLADVPPSDPAALLADAPPAAGSAGVLPPQAAATAASRSRAGRSRAAASTAGRVAASRQPPAALAACSKGSAAAQRHCLQQQCTKRSLRDQAACVKLRRRH